MQSHFITHPVYGFTFPAEETWKDIPGYEGYYQVSTWGNVRSLDRYVKCNRGSVRIAYGKPVKIFRAPKTGHSFVNLQKECKHYGARVHRLVLETFVGPCPESMEGCHFPDRNGANNRLENLRWDTRSGNVQDMLIHGTHKKPGFKGEECSHTILTEGHVRQIRRLYAEGWRMSQLARRYPQVSRTAIGYIVHRKTWKHI